MAQAKKATIEGAVRPRTTVQIPHASSAHREVSRRSQDGQRGASYNYVAVRDLESYYALLVFGRQQLRKRFTDAELDFFAEVIGEQTWEAHELAILPREVKMVAEERRGEVRKKLFRAAARLRNSAPSTLMALVDACEEYRRHPRKYRSLGDCINKLDRDV